MPKPINQRGFEVSKGNLSKIYISYSIDENGLEQVNLYKGFSVEDNKRSSLSMAFDEGNLQYIIYSTPQFKEAEKNLEEWQEKMQQALAIYREVKRILKVDEKIKEYIPRFSSLSEVTPFNILDIDSEDDLEGLVNQQKCQLI